MTKAKLLLIPYGERDGQLVHISEVDGGLDCNCLCPECRSPLVARKGLKITHHFAHHRSPECDAETVMHHIAKRLLFQRISAAIASKEALPIQWNCNLCSDTHEGNLVKRATSVKQDYSFGPCPPDLTLFNEKGSPVAFIEVIVSRQPEESVRTFAAEYKVSIVEFHINSAEDLDALVRPGKLTATRIDYCNRPKCARCKRPLQNKTLHVVDAPCWKCNRQMKVAILEVEGVCSGPDDFSKDDVALARARGALLKENYSKTVGERYVSNTCPNCGAFVGSFFLHDYFYLMSKDTGHSAGWACLWCEDDS